MISTILAKKYIRTESLQKFSEHVNLFLEGIGQYIVAPRYLTKRRISQSNTANIQANCIPYFTLCKHKNSIVSITAIAEEIVTTRYIRNSP